MSSSLQKNNNRDNDIEEGDATVPSKTQANSMFTTSEPTTMKPTPNPTTRRPTPSPTALSADVASGNYC